MENVDILWLIWGKFRREKREIVTYIDQMIWLMINDGKIAGDGITNNMTAKQRISSLTVYTSFMGIKPLTGYNLWSSWIDSVSIYIGYHRMVFNGFWDVAICWNRILRDIFTGYHTDSKPDLRDMLSHVWWSKLRRKRYPSPSNEIRQLVENGFPFRWVIIIPQKKTVAQVPTY